MRYILFLLLVTGCADGDVEVSDSKHMAYVSAAESWREVCEDRFNEYDYPNVYERDRLQAECRRRFADGEETLPLPELPGNALEL